MLSFFFIEVNAVTCVAFFLFLPVGVKDTNATQVNKKTNLYKLEGFIQVIKFDFVVQTLCRTKIFYSSEKH